MMAKINHFRNEARDGTNDHFHLTPSRLFGIDMKIVRHFFLQVAVLFSKSAYRPFAMK